MKSGIGFLPRFVKYKHELLEQKTPRAIQLPPAVEACLEGNKPFVSSAGRLWIECIRVTRSFWMQSIGVSCVTALCATVATLAGMRLLKASGEFYNLAGLALLYFFANIVGQVSAFFNNHLRNWASQAIQAYLVNLISRKLLRLSYRAATQRTSGSLKVLITSDTQYVADFVDNAIRNFIPAAVALFVVLPLLVHLTGKAGLIGVLVMMMILPISLLLNQVSVQLQDKGQRALDHLASLLEEWIKNVRLVRYLSWDDSFQNEVYLRLRKYMGLATGQHVMACIIFGLSVSWWMVAIVGVFVVAKRFGIQMDVIGFFGALWLITFLAGYLNHLPTTIRFLASAVPSMKRIAKLLSEEEQEDLFIPENQAEVTPGNQTEGISGNRTVDLSSANPVRVIFENVSFTYHGGKEAIRNISLSIPVDRKIAIVGEVGCGKTTFLKLLCGEFPPTEGSIWVEFDNGISRNLWTQSCYEALRKQIAWVPQDPFISCDPLSTNISLMSGRDEELALTQAAYWAELESDLLAFPNGISEEIGEGGINLSGGQKQRLNLARAYYSNRKYLVLDDSLSAVDSHTESALMNRLEKLKNGFVLVTHRTAELMRVEEVLVMKQGRFIERGNPGELVANPYSQYSRVLKAYEKDYEKAYENEVSHE